MNIDNIRWDLECLVSKRPLAQNDSLVCLLQRLDVASKSPNLHEQLKHYLSKRSYVKAIEWLDNPDMPHRQ